MSTGVLVNVLNPKVALFFLAFLLKFVPTGADAPAAMALLGGVYSALTLAYLSGVALFSGALGAGLAVRTIPASGRHRCI